MQDVRDRLEAIKARDIMSKFAITVKEADLLIKAAHLMMRFKISGMPVINEEHKIVGIITATDLFRIMSSNFASDSHLDIRGIIISDVMTKQVHSIDESASLVQMIKIMFAENIHTIPVVKGSDIVGIIGRRDVIFTYYNVVGIGD